LLRVVFKDHFKMDFDDQFIVSQCSLSTWVEPLCVCFHSISVSRIVFCIRSPRLGSLLSAELI